MSEAPIAIRAHNLSKIYRIYRNPVHALTESITHKPRHIRRTALDNINLEVRRGEIVGVLGRNGAGKSTLLKIVAGTLERTGGELDVNGRVTAILELGSGFHPDYTGRENIYMGGMCLGMSRKEVDSKVESIIEFSELREVIDQPFKTYSTGMQARLTFSVAISVDPDILIVDEALSVGDARFQQKCFSWMNRLRARSVTVLLVTHDTNTITSLCDRAIILENGRVYSEGDVRSVASVYLKLLFGSTQSVGGVDTLATVKASHAPPTPIACTVTKEQAQPAVITESVQARVTKASADSVVQDSVKSQQLTLDAGGVRQNDNLWAGRHTDNTQRFGTGEAKLLEWGMLDGSGQQCRVFESGKRCRFYMTLHCERDIKDISCGFAIKDRRGTVLWGVTNIAQGRQAYQARAGETFNVIADCSIWFAAGDYFVNLGAGHLDNSEMLDFVEDAIHFRVNGPGGIFTTAVVNLQTTFKMQSGTPA